MGCILRAWFLFGVSDPETAKRVLKPIAHLMGVRHVRGGVDRSGKSDESDRAEPPDRPDTIERLFKSKHVDDLRLIASIAFIMLCWAAFFSALFAYDTALVYKTSHAAAQWDSPAVYVKLSHDFFKVFAPVLVVFGGIMAWAYQVGSARLGVVDLFACEIDTLCRMTTVGGVVGRQVASFKNGPTVKSGVRGASVFQVSQFVSQENYFPVFDNNSRDLQALEAGVVINITAFYTYMKAVRDCMRKLADVRPRAFESRQPVDETAVAGPWHESLRSMLYMLYLALESARKATGDLVEYRPEQTERTMVVLISELEAYGFLRSQYDNREEMRHQRLELRQAEYDTLVCDLRELINKNNPAQTRALPTTLQERLWRQAFELLHGLNQRFSELPTVPAEPAPAVTALRSVASN